jgi:hypothetical protein
MLCAMKAFGFAFVCCAALALAAADDAFARGRSGGGSGHSFSGFSGHSAHFASPGFRAGFPRVVPRFHNRVFIGAGIVAAPIFFPPPYSYYYAPAPAYYYPPPPPPEYIEQAPEAALQSQQYWYYCPDTRAYYPYVSECAGGWQRVLPNTQSPPAG